MTSAIYIYGIIKTDSPLDFGAIGIGNPRTEVTTIGFKDLAAVVSHSPFTAYDSLTKENTVKDLVTHQFVIEKVMQSATVLPVKFGTMLATGQELSEFLEKGYALLHDELRKMEGKIELNVVASWDLPKILESLSSQHPHIQAQRKAITQKGAQASVAEKVTLGKSIALALETQKNAYHQLVLQTLKQQALDVCLHDVANNEMFFNAAFLLEKQGEELFNKVVTGLDQTLEGTVNFRVVGPLPVYSFSTILLQKIDQRSFAEAKKILGLDGEITSKTVRDAYHHLARQSHPDKSCGADPAGFHLVNAAYKTLKNCVEHGLTHVEIYRWEQNLQ